MAPAALPEELRYYVVRGGNAIIPMVPVDQLPHGLELEGIPRRLTPRQKSDEGWKSTYNTEHPAVTLEIKNPRPSNSRRHLSSIEVRLPPTPEASPQYLAPDHLVRSEAGKVSGASRQASQYTDRSTTVERYSGQPCTSRPATPEHTTSSSCTPESTYVQESLRFGHCRPNPSGLVPDHSKKVYCTHWMRTGSCDFTQQGCRYKHEMPSKAKLLELGYRQIPLWWKEKPAIRTPTWVEEHRAATKSSENEPPPPCAHDRLSWIDSLPLKQYAQNKDDQLLSTPEQRPDTSEPKKLVTSTIAQIQPQDLTCTLRCGFVDDLINLHDDTNDATGLDTAMGASSGVIQASLSTRLSLSQPAPVLKSITKDAINARLLPGVAIEQDNEEHPDTDPMASCTPGHRRDNDTGPMDSSCDNTGTAFKPTRSYHKSQKHNGLEASKHATARVKTTKFIEAYGKPVASSAEQPISEDAHAVVKRSRPIRRQIKPAKRGLRNDAVRGVSK
jgi:hypothetical protein